jgi:anthranilate 1,2-dioxygenase large subunit/terephthalate 1,2-dioxygenase oxygenase component alpha subunit
MMDATTTPRNSTEPFSWPLEGVSRVPYRVFHDPQLYVTEQEKIFRGETWSFLTLEIEIPNPGDFKTSFVGDTSVVTVRLPDGNIHAFVNRCAHRGSLLCFRNTGQVSNFQCVYHNWTYDLDGKLIGVPFRRGLRGQGGMPADFDMAKHGLTPLRVERLSGLVFGSFSPTAKPLAEYLGSRMAQHISRTLCKPIRVIGSYSQYLRNNWKLYMENVKDSYHASLLHTFLTTFRLNTLAMEGGLVLDDTGAHSLTYAKVVTEVRTETEYESGGLRAQDDTFRLKDKSLLERWTEHSDGVTHSILTIFPCLTLFQIGNSLGLRLLVPRGPDESELFWTLLGFEDDTEEQQAMRLRQSNLVGPGGLVSMEDAVVGNFIQRATLRDTDRLGVVEMGGRTVESQQSRASEVMVRGFWKAYREMMGL